MFPNVTVSHMSLFTFLFYFPLLASSIGNAIVSQCDCGPHDTFDSRLLATCTAKLIDPIQIIGFNWRAQFFLGGHYSLTWAGGSINQLDQ